MNGMTWSLVLTLQAVRKETESAAHQQRLQRGSTNEFNEELRFPWTFDSVNFENERRGHCYTLSRSVLKIPIYVGHIQG